MHPILRLIRFDKPVGTLLLLWPTFWALWLANSGFPSLKLIIIFGLGTFLMRSAGCIINDIADRKFDGLVVRTANRPLVSHEVSLTTALLLFLFLMLLAAGLALCLPPLCWSLAVMGALLTVIYPFAKRFISAPQLVLGLAFSWGIPMAYAASLNTIPSEAWFLMAITWLWIMIYDTIYALADREDDLQCGIASTAILFGKYATQIIGLLQSIMMIGLLLFGIWINAAWPFYLALMLTVGFFLRQQFLIRTPELHSCIQAFKSNQWIGLAIFLGIIYQP